MGYARGRIRRRVVRASHTSLPVPWGPLVVSFSPVVAADDDWCGESGPDSPARTCHVNKTSIKHSMHGTKTTVHENLFHEYFPASFCSVKHEASAEFDTSSKLQCTVFTQEKVAAEYKVHAPQL